jgi:hypothetical protein
VYGRGSGGGVLDLLQAGGTLAPVGAGTCPHSVQQAPNRRAGPLVSVGELQDHQAVLGQSEVVVRGSDLGQHMGAKVRQVGRDRSLQRHGKQATRGVVAFLIKMTPSGPQCCDSNRRV